MTNRAMLPKNARPRLDGTIDIPQRGVPKQIEGWIQDARMPWHYYPEGSLGDCSFRLVVDEIIPCCGKTRRVRCTAFERALPINYNTCSRCRGTEEGIAKIQETING